MVTFVSPMSSLTYFNASHSMSNAGRNDSDTYRDAPTETDHRVFFVRLKGFAPPMRFAYSLVLKSDIRTITSWG
jgi:hypothetical protein